MPVCFEKFTSKCQRKMSHQQLKKLIILKVFWEFINRNNFDNKSSKNKNQKNNYILDNDKTENDKTKITNFINGYFINGVKKLTKISQCKKKKITSECIENMIFLEPVRFDEINRIIDSLNTNTVKEPDNILVNFKR